MVERQLVLGFAGCLVAWTTFACAKAELSFPAGSGILAVSTSGEPAALTVVKGGRPVCGEQLTRAEINAATESARFLAPVDPVAAEAIAAQCSDVVLSCEEGDVGCFPLLFAESFRFDAGAWRDDDEQTEILVPTECGASFTIEQTIELGLDSPPVAISSSGVIYASSGADVFRLDPSNYERSLPRRVADTAELVALSVDEDGRLWALSETALYRQRGVGVFDAKAFEEAEFDNVTIDQALDIDVSVAFENGVGSQLAVTNEWIVVGSVSAFIFGNPSSAAVTRVRPAPYRVRRLAMGIGVAALDRVWSVAEGQELEITGLSPGAGSRRFFARAGSTVVGGHELGYRLNQATSFMDVVPLNLDGLVELGSIDNPESVLAISRSGESLLLRATESDRAACVTRVPILCDELYAESAGNQIFVACTKDASTSVVVLAIAQR